jgi:hypothetical protein
MPIAIGRSCLAVVWVSSLLLLLLLQLRRKTRFHHAA